MLLVIGNLTNLIQNDAKHLKITKPWNMGTHLRVLSKSIPMDTNMNGFIWLSNSFKSLCIG